MRKSVSKELAKLSKFGKGRIESSVAPPTQSVALPQSYGTKNASTWPHDEVVCARHTIWRRRR